MNADPPKLYGSFAKWFHLLTRPEDYVEEAEFYRGAIISAATATPRTLLELGCGGGNNAYHLKAHFQLTLTDISPNMLELSRSINSDCEHVLGDMRTMRLGRVFDAVFIHDAIDYLTTLAELRQAIETAWIHCGPGGVVLLAPDSLRETFRPRTSYGGHDDATRGMRYVEWTWDPDPSDETYVVDYAYLLRNETGEVRVESDRHRLGLFRRSEWLDTMHRVGFEPRVIPFHHSEVEPGTLEVFVGVKSHG